MGQAHCLAITAGGDVYAWGRGDTGQLGIGRHEDALVPTKVLDVKHALTCSAGEEHSAVVCRSTPGNQLFTWGSAHTGKLGVQNRLKMHKLPPTPVDALGEKQVSPTAVHCGQYHTVVTATPLDGIHPQRLWTFGGGWYGRLGHGNQENVYTPKLVESLDGFVMSAACGAYHTCALILDSELRGSNTEAGSLWFWGRDRMVCEHVDILTPKRAPFPEDLKFVSIVCGLEHTFAVSDDLFVWAWGDNTNGQLGELSRDSQSSEYQPCKTRLPSTPVVLATGSAHSVAYFRNKETYSWGNQRGGRLGLADPTESKVVNRPAKVKSAWASLEAALEVAPLEQEGEAEEAPQKDNPQWTKQMKALKTGQYKALSFGTMQTLLKSEPNDRRVQALKAQEAKLNLELSKFIREIKLLPEKEQEAVKLQADLEHSFCANLRRIKKVPGPDYGHMVPGKIAARLGYYEELLWILQQQGAYLGTLAMYLSRDDEETFFEVLNRVFEELDDARTMHLFRALLKQVITREIEQAKNLAGFFHKESSRVFHMFSAFALQRVHFKEVVHPVMDCTFLDKEGNRTLLGLIVELTNAHQHICFSIEEFKQAPAKRTKFKEQEYEEAEIKSEFNANLEIVRRFILGDFLKALRRYKLPNSLLKMFDSAVQEIKRRRFPDAVSNQGISAELMVFTPLLQLFVKGVLIPMFRRPKKYAGREVFLEVCERDAMEPDVVFNLEHLSNLLEAVVSGAESDNQAVDNIRRQLKPELLTSIADSLIGVVDDTDTQLTVDLYISHFDRTRHYVSMRTPTLMKLSNLLRRNLSKLRLNENDAVDRLCEKIGEWTAEEIQAAEKNEHMHNFIMNTRFLLKESNVVICSASRCPVPPRLSAHLHSSEEDSMLVAQFTGDPGTKYSGGQLLEELLYELGPIRGTTFDDLTEELKKMLNECEGKSPPDYTMAHRLSQGISTIAELKKLEATPTDLLEWMVSCLADRDRHSIYLEQVHNGIESIDMKCREFYSDLEEAKQELRQALHFSRTLHLPQQMVKQGRAQGVRLKLDVVAGRTDDGEDFGRKKVQGCSYAPMVTESLVHLKKEHIITKVSPWLDHMDQAGTHVHFTFALMNNGLDMTVTVSRTKGWKVIKSNVKQLRISEEKFRELRRAQEGAVVELPEEGEPLVVFASSKLVMMLAKIANH